MIPKIASLSTFEAFTTHLERLGIELPADEHVDAAGALASPIEIDGRVAANRFVALPMEGWDGTDDGRPSDLVRRRWSRIGAGGASVVWGEATAVRSDGRANANQLVLRPEFVEDFASLRSLLAPDQIAGLQLTHSGRYAKPTPRVAYRHPILADDDHAVFTDDELDELAAQYVDAAALAAEAGFDFVDVKHCHGYLLHELLSAYDRRGRYGGDLSGRTRFLRTVVDGIRTRAPELRVAVRFSMFDFVPFRKGPDETGEPRDSAPYRHAFGGDGSGTGVDLSEPNAFLDVLEELGIELVCTTAGSPYTNPHIQRPAYFPPSDGYLPPEDPLVGVARQIAATAELQRRHPKVAIVGSGYSYLQEWLPHVAQAVVRTGGASMIGLGRMMLAYPSFPSDVLEGRGTNRRALCRTFSDCTTAPRNGMISGCYPLDPFYKERDERKRLVQLKKHN